MLDSCLELLAPGFCRECGREGLPGDLAYCEMCQATIRWVAHACPACGNPFAAAPCLSPSAREPICGVCIGQNRGESRSRFHFDRVAAAGVYDSVLRSAILRYKFHHDEGVRPFLVEVAAYAAQRSWIRDYVSEADALVPVPQHWWRGLRRGWNPVGELAEALATELMPPRHLPVRSLLRKIRWTTPQVDLSGRVRRRNLRRAFVVRPGEKPPRRVILFDDVLTTGTTASECARALKRAGAESVVLVALARSLTE